VHTQVLIDAIVQQTMVFIAQLATAGGIRAPLARVANQVFLDLVNELSSQGVKKKVIADMFGMALRTYHRRIHELSVSQTDAGHTLWESVLGFLREREAVSNQQIHRRFRNDDPEVLTGVLNDLVGSGLVYRAGRGDGALYRVASEVDLAAIDEEHRREAAEYLTWLAVYRHGPVELPRIAELTRLGTESCEVALATLTADGRVEQQAQGYVAREFSVPLGSAQGWEAAVLDHFQAMVGAISAKLSRATYRSQARDVVGGSTWSLDVWDGHPLQEEALGTLARVRAELEDLRTRVDAHTPSDASSSSGSSGRTRTSGPRGAARQRVVFYLGQYVREDASAEQDPRENEREST
jgi:hypothetical protein